MKTEQFMFSLRVAGGLLRKYHVVWFSVYLCVYRLLPGLVLSSAISVLQCNEYYLMAVTTGGDVFVWLVVCWFCRICGGMLGLGLV